MDQPDPYWEWDQDPKCHVVQSGMICVALIEMQLVRTPQLLHLSLQGNPNHIW
jgi:hypothetical protein